MRSVVLSGFMGTGKSTIGPKLASRLGVAFVDTDAEIERSAGRTIPALWAEEGEASFRLREAKLVEELLGRGAPQVIAFGGGTVTVERIRHIALDRGIVVTLTASPETVVARTPDVHARPNLAVGGDPVARAGELIAQRAAAYGECHMAVSTDGVSVDQVVDAVIALVKRSPLVVPLGTRSYCIDVCDGEPARLTDAIARCSPSSLVVVTDSNVERLRGAAIEVALRAVDVPSTRVTLPPGERYKTLSSVGAIWDAALGAGVDRDALVVAVGGGVVGDLGGFAAACLLRGVRFVQAPTTLLAMVDASVGGKTGFDHPVGKNLVGAFHQPCAVVADLVHLETLPVRELRAGLAEVVKIALALDASLLDQLEAKAEGLRGADRGVLGPIVRQAVAAKIRVVRDDERESGRRAVLNLGHTVGHALEAYGGYARWLHGEAVALGLLVEMRAMAWLGRTPRSLVDRAQKLLEALGLVTHVAGSDVAASWGYVAADKKRSLGGVRFVVVSEAGVCRVERLSIAELEAAVVGASGAE
jgi:shikimate kinase / 3-dehydroquinate synthase